MRAFQSAQGHWLGAFWGLLGPNLPHIYSFFGHLLFCLQLGPYHTACHHLMSKDIVWQLLTASLSSFLLSSFGPLSSEDVLLGLEGHFIMQAFAFCPRLSDVPRSNVPVTPLGYFSWPCWIPPYAILDDVFSISSWISWINAKNGKQLLCPAQASLNSQSDSAE